MTTPRRLGPEEIEAVLALDVPARLATLDADGYPHVVPLWFVWSGEAFVMTSLAGRPHLRRLAADPRAGIVVDAEDAQRADGERPNRQVRAVGDVELAPDVDGEWTRRITRKYVHGAALPARTATRVAADRRAIVLRPRRLVAVAST